MSKLEYGEPSVCRTKSRSSSERSRARTGAITVERSCIGLVSYQLQ